MRHSRGVWLPLAFLLVGMILAGCAKVAEAPAEDRGADIKPIDGSALRKVTLTEGSMQSLGVTTKPVAGQQVKGARASEGTTIPIAALVYDPEGKTWTYTQTGDREFVRAPVAIDRIQGGTVYLKSGLPPGTQIVVVGAAQLLGAEYGVGEE